MTNIVLPTRSVLTATPRTRLLTLDLGSRAFSFAAGQAVCAGLADSQARRPYSIACSPTHARETKTLELLVQIDDHVAPDPHLERAVPGTLLDIEGPFGSFSLASPLLERHVLFVAGGTGIAPLRSMLWEILAEHPSVRPALVYSARGPEEFAFRHELDDLALEGRIELRLTITRHSALSWGGSRGRIDARLLQSLLVTPETRCFICGPPPLVTDTVALLEAAGVSGERIGWDR